MVENAELQELYCLIADMLDGYNKTHDAQVQFVDFAALVPDRMVYSYNGSVVCREYEDNIIDYHYRDLMPDDFDWYTPDDWAQAVVDRDAIAEANRKQAQRYHREGRNLSTLWFVRYR